MGAVLALLTNMLRVMLFMHAGKIIVGILGFFGLEYITYHYGIAPALAWISDLMTTGPGGEFGAACIAWMGVMQFDRAVTMLLSAWGIAQTIKSAKSFLGKS
jgi:hypothetical protein